jgi:hypothetical protein
MRGFARRSSETRDVTLALPINRGEKRMSAFNGVTNTTGLDLYTKTSDSPLTFQPIGPVITPQIMAGPIYVEAYPNRRVSYVQLNGATVPNPEQLGDLNGGHIRAIYRARKLLTENGPPAT